MRVLDSGSSARELLARLDQGEARGAKWLEAGLSVGVKASARAGQVFIGRHRQSISVLRGRIERQPDTKISGGVEETTNSPSL